MVVENKEKMNDQTPFLKHKIASQISEPEEEEKTPFLKTPSSKKHNFRRNPEKYALPIFLFTSLTQKAVTF